MSLATIAALITALLLFSLLVFKVVQMLARPRGAARRAPRADRVVESEEVQEIAEGGEDLVEEERPSWAEDELGAEPGGEREKPKIEKEEKRHAAKAPAAKAAPDKKPVKKVQIPEKKKLSNVSPQDYPECFGTPDAYENCERSCGVVEECESAISVLRKFTD